MRIKVDRIDQPVLKSLGEEIYLWPKSIGYMVIGIYSLLAYGGISYYTDDLSFEADFNEG